MKAMGVLRGVLVLLAALGCCLPQARGTTQTNPDQAALVVDVALLDGGALIGQVVDAQGQPMADQAVSLHDQQQEIARAVTDRQGRFVFRNLRGGVYQITAAEGHGAFCLWTPGTAPPTCQQAALVVAGQEVVRGGFMSYLPRGGWLKFWLSDPWVLTGLTAAAVTVPIAVHNFEKPSSP